MSRFVSLTQNNARKIAHRQGVGDTAKKQNENETYKIRTV